TTIERKLATAEGWVVRDRSLADVATPVRTIEFQVDGSLLLGERDADVGYQVDGAASYRTEPLTNGKSDVIAAQPASPADFRRPAVVDIRTGSKTMRLEVLDAYCGH